MGEIFDAIRKVLDLYNAGNLWSLAAARLVNELIGKVLAAMDDGHVALAPTAARKGAPRARLGSLKSVMKQLEALVPADPDAAALKGFAIDWLSLLPLLVQILQQILAGKK